MEADSGPFRYALSIPLSVFTLTLFIYYIPLCRPPPPSPSQQDKMLLLAAILTLITNELQGY